MNSALEKINKIINIHDRKSLIGLADVSEAEYREFRRIFDQVVLKPKSSSVNYADRAFIVAAGAVLFDMFEHEDSKYWESLARKYELEETAVRATITPLMDHFYSTKGLPRYKTSRNEYVETIKMQSIISKNRIGNVTQVFYTIYLNDLERDISPSAVNMLAKFLRTLFLADIQGDYFDLKYNDTKMSEMRQMLPKAFMRAYVTNTNPVAKIMYEFFRYFDAVHLGVPYDGKMTTRLKAQLEEELKKNKHRYPGLAKGKKKQSTMDENKARLVTAKKNRNRVLGVAIPKHFVELDNQGRQNAKVKLYSEKKMVRMEKLQARQGGIAWRTLPKTINFNQEYPYLRYEVVGNDKIYYDSKDELYTGAEKQRLEESEKRKKLKMSEIIEKKPEKPQGKDAELPEKATIKEATELRPERPSNDTEPDAKGDMVSGDYQITWRSNNGNQPVEATDLATGELYDLKLDKRNEVLFKNTSYEMSTEGNTANYRFYLNNDSLIMINHKIINLQQKKRKMGFSEVSREAHVRYKEKAHQIVFQCQSFHFPLKTGNVLSDYIFEINGRVITKESLEQSIVQNGMSSNLDWNTYYVFDFTRFIENHEKAIQIEIRLKNSSFIVLQRNYYRLEKFYYAFSKTGKNIRRNISVDRFQVNDVTLTPENQSKHQIRIDEGCFLFQMKIEAQPFTVAVDLDSIAILEKNNHSDSKIRFDWKGQLIPSRANVEKVKEAQKKPELFPVIHPNIREIHEDIYVSAAELLNGIENIDTLTLKLMFKYPSESERATRKKVLLYNSIIFDQLVTVLPDITFIQYLLDRIYSENVDTIVHYVLEHFYRYIESNPYTENSDELKSLLVHFTNEKGNQSKVPVLGESLEGGIENESVGDNDQTSSLKEYNAGLHQLEEAIFAEFDSITKNMLNRLYKYACLTFTSTTRLKRYAHELSNEFTDYDAVFFVEMMEAFHKIAEDKEVSLIPNVTYMEYLIIQYAKEYHFLTVETALVGLEKFAMQEKNDEIKNAIFNHMQLLREEISDPVTPLENEEQLSVTK